MELAKAKMKVLAARLEAKKRKRGDEVKVEVVIPKRGAETAKRRKTGTAASVEASTVGEVSRNALSDGIGANRSGVRRRTGHVGRAPGCSQDSGRPRKEG